MDVKKLKSTPILFQTHDRMGTNHEGGRENNSMVIGLGHMVLLFMMLLGSLVLSIITLACESVTRKVLKLYGRGLHRQEYA